MLRVFIAGPSSCGGWSFWRRRARRAASRLSLSTRRALRAARRVGRIAAFRGPWDRRGDSRREAAGVVDTLWQGAVSGACVGRWLPSAAWCGSTCGETGAAAARRATLGGGAGERAGRWTGGEQTFSLGPAAPSASGASTQQSACGSAALAPAASTKIAWRSFRARSLSVAKCWDMCPFSRAAMSWRWPLWSLRVLKLG